MSVSKYEASREKYDCNDDEAKMSSQNKTSAHSSHVTGICFCFPHGFLFT